LPLPADLIMYTELLRIDAMGENEKEARNLMKKIDRTFDHLKIYDHFTRISFLLGIIVLLIYALINFLN